MTPEEILLRDTVLGPSFLSSEQRQAVINLVRAYQREAIAQARAEALQEAADAILRYPFAWPRHMPEELAACIKTLPGAQP